MAFGMKIKKTEKKAYEEGRKTPGEGGGSTEGSNGENSFEGREKERKTEMSQEER